MTLAMPNEQMDTMQIKVFVVAKGNKIDAGCCSGTGISVIFACSQPCLSAPALLTLCDTLWYLWDTVHTTHLPPEPPVPIRSSRTILYGEL